MVDFMHGLMTFVGIIVTILFAILACAYAFMDDADKLAVTEHEYQDAEDFLQTLSDVEDVAKRELIATDYAVSYVRGDSTKLDAIEKRVKQIIIEQGVK